MNDLRLYKPTWHLCGVQGIFNLERLYATGTVNFEPRACILVIRLALLPRGFMKGEKRIFWLLAGYRPPASHLVRLWSLLEALDIY